jgi:hypothetical protein
MGADIEEGGTDIDRDGNANGKVDSFVYMTHHSTNNVGTVTISKVNKTTAEVTWTNAHNPVTGNPGAKAELEIPLYVKLTGEGEAVVEIEPRDSQISADRLTFAVSASGATIASIDSVEVIDDNGDIAAITIDETKINAIGTANQTIKLKLPPDFYWDGVDNGYVTFSGGLRGATATATGDEQRELVINLRGLPGSRTTRGTIVIDGVNVAAESGAKFGDVDVKITGDKVTTQTLTVAKYVDYGITIKADGEPKELIAGRWSTDPDGSTDPYDGVFELQKLVIKEDIENSWLAQRKTRIEFPSWVKIVSFDVKKADKLSGIGTGSSTTSANGISLDRDRNYVEFSATSVTGKAAFEIVFYVSVEANATGDITATVSGRSLLEEAEVVLGKAVAPVTVDVEVKDVKIGRQNEEIGKITITETQEEAIMDGDIKVRLAQGFDWNATPKVEVTEGDVEITNVKVSSNILTITVEGDSRDVSTIEITGGKVDLNRVLPEGKFDLQVAGNALVRNSDGDDTDGDAEFETAFVVETTFANIVTPNVDDLAKGVASAQKATFTVGSADYTVGAEVATADAVPYIKDGRTMIPVKYAAYALGIDPSNIKWDQTNKTVTILGDRVIQVKVGSKDLLVSGATLTMDAAAEVVDGRTYLPISWVASALNVNYSYDDATKTVTFN